MSPVDRAVFHTPTLFVYVGLTSAFVSAFNAPTGLSRIFQSCSELIEECTKNFSSGTKQIDVCASQFVKNINIQTFECVNSHNIWLGEKNLNNLMFFHSICLRSTIYFKIPGMQALSKPWKVINDKIVFPVLSQWAEYFIAAIHQFGLSTRGKFPETEKPPRKMTQREHSRFAPEVGQ